MCPLVVAVVVVVGGGWLGSAPELLAPSNGTVITMAAAPASAATRGVKKAARNLDMIPPGFPPTPCCAYPEEFMPEISPDNALPVSE
jgi:hypothetical protein